MHVQAMWEPATGVGRGRYREGLGAHAWRGCWPTGQRGEWCSWRVRIPPVSELNCSSITSFDLGRRFGDRMDQRKWATWLNEGVEVAAGL
jgi:hypothetical protein